MSGVNKYGATADMLNHQTRLELIDAAILIDEALRLSTRVGYTDARQFYVEDPDGLVACARTIIGEHYANRDQNFLWHVHVSNQTTDSTTLNDAQTLIKAVSENPEAHPHLVQMIRALDNLPYLSKQQAPQTGR